MAREDVTAPPWFDYDGPEIPRVSCKDCGGGLQLVDNLAWCEWCGKFVHSKRIDTQLRKARERAKWSE